VATGEIRQILLNKIAALSANYWSALRGNWGAASVNPIRHPVKKRIGKHLERVA
jgi:hypothetical protein